MADGFLQIRHLDRSQRRLKSLVAHLQSGAIDRLFEILAGEHAECMRHSRILCRLPDATRDFVDYHVVMGGVPANQAPETDDGIVFVGFSKCARSRRNFERAGNAHDMNVFFPRTGANQPVISASQQPVSYKFIKAGNHDAETEPRRIQFSSNRLCPNFLFGVFLRVGACPDRSRKMSLWRDG
jgi:hypothetical protein